MKLMYWIVLLVLLAPIHVFADNKTSQDENACTGDDARYEPFEYKHARGDFLDFKLSIDKGDRNKTPASAFINISVYNHETKKYLGTRRLPYICSNGIVTCNLAAYTDKPGAFSSILTFKKDFSGAFWEGGPAPYAIVIADISEMFQKPDDFPAKAADFLNSLPDQELMKYRPGAFVPSVYIFNSCKSSKAIKDYKRPLKL